MNKRLLEIEARKKEIKGLIDTADMDTLGKFDEELRQLDDEKAQIEKREALTAKLAANAIEVREIAKPEQEKRTVEKTVAKEMGPNEFREFGDFLQTVRWNPSDSALKAKEVKNIEGRVLQMGVGAMGGFIVPEQFDRNIKMVQDNAAIFRPRCQVIPAGDPPDAAITIPALDQSGANGVYSGVQVTWIAEGDTKPETEPSFREIKLEPNEVAAHTVVTDKLLRNSAAAGALVMSLLRKAIIAAEEDAFYTGNGVGRPLGIIGHPASINVARAGAGAIAYADVVGMYARMKMGGRFAWIASQTCLPQLMTMADVGNNLVWQPNARDGAPGTLLGIPVLINDQSPILGVQGDLALVDLDYYLIKDGSGISISMSEHPRFTRNQTIIRAFWNVDGQPWLTTPLLQRDGVSTVSPFVVLT
jgi:HK97 family phage major capsid protein